MPIRAAVGLICSLALATGAGANEVTLKNDSLTSFGGAAIVWGFAPGEMAASWLTSPCDGNLVAVQIFWRSPSGTSAAVIGDSINIYRSGTFPAPGVLALSVGGPVLNDNALNEYRYLDENNTLPISVPLSQSETVVVGLEFASTEQPNVDPSVVRDTDGIQPNRNTIYGDIGLGLNWYSASDLGVTGDWVIRAVVNCQSVASTADVGVNMTSTPTAYTPGAPLHYTITVGNSGPAASANTTIVDNFPSAFSNVSWACTASGGASCTAAGSGNIIDFANLPAGGQAIYTVDGTIASGTVGLLSNSASAIVQAPAMDPNTANNTATLDLQPASSDVIFADGFESSTR